MLYDCVYKYLLGGIGVAEEKPASIILPILLGVPGTTKKRREPIVVVTSGYEEIF